MLKSAPEINKALPDFINFLEDDIVVDHNVNFDINFIYDATKQTCSKEFKNNYIDTLRLSRRLLPALSHHRLDDLIAFYCLDKRDEHRALNDCEHTSSIFNKLMDTAIAKHGSLEEFVVTTKKHSSDIKAKDIVADGENFDIFHPLYNKVCVFTGTLEKMQRIKATNRKRQRR